MLTGTRVFIALCILLSAPTAVAQARSPQINRPLDLEYPQQEVSDAHAGVSELLGDASAMDGNTAIVGAEAAQVGGVVTGKAFVYTYDGTSWSLQSALKASDGAASDAFGFSVAISGNTAIVSAPYHTVGSKTDVGVAYVFVRNGTAWTQQAELVPSDGAASDFFGASVAIYGNTAVIGSSFHQVGTHLQQGTAYVYVRQLTTWSFQAELNGPGGATGDSWGKSVALYGNTALVGGPYHAVNGLTGAGAANVFVRSGALWSFQAQLTAPDGVAGDYLGWASALSGNTALVGSPHHKLTVNNQGTGYVFTRSGTTWSLQEQLVSSTPQIGVGFAAAVALSGNYAAIGAPYYQVGTTSQQGAAWVFVRSGDIWYQQGPALVSSDGAQYDGFGNSVAISGIHVLAGAPGKDINSTPNAGAGYFLTPYRPDDLQVTASGPTWVLHPDDISSLTATVMDHGNTESNILLKISFPSGGLAYQSDTPSQGSYDRSTASWYVGTLIPGATATLTISAKVEPPVNNSQILTFRAISLIPDINDADNTASASFTVAKVQQLVNGGFENYSGNSRIPIDWLDHNFSLTDGKDTSAGNHVQGSTSVRIANTSLVTKVLKQELFGPTGSAGEAFTLSYWVKGDSVPATGLCLERVQFYLASSPVGSPVTLACGLTGTFGFTQRKLLFKAPANYDDVIVAFVYGESSGTVWFDAASLLR